MSPFKYLAWLIAAEWTNQAQKFHLQLTRCQIHSHNEVYVYRIEYCMYKKPSSEYRHSRESRLDKWTPVVEINSSTVIYFPITHMKDDNELKWINIIQALWTSCSMYVAWNAFRAHHRPLSFCCNPMLNLIMHGKLVLLLNEQNWHTGVAVYHA